MSSESDFIEMSKRDKAAIVAHSQLLFIDLFFKDEFTIPANRTDLPEEWRGQMIKSEKQRMMICDRKGQVAYRTSRKVSKTQILAAKFFRWTIWHAGRKGTDGLIHCPREHHLTKLRLTIQQKINHTPLFHLICTKVNVSKGLIETSTGIMWYMRIEGKTKTGESMVGPAAEYELGDEQDYAGLEAYNERQQAMLPGARRCLAGVPRGVQGGPFWLMANRKEFSEGWSVFTGKEGYNCFINPIYCSPQADRELEIKHGGKETQAYQTQVLGLDGMRVFSSFPIIPMVVQDFTSIEVTGEDVDNAILLAELATVSWTPSETYVIAGDLGRSPAPTEIWILRWYEGAWIQMLRMHLTISDSFQTATAIHQLNISLPHRASLIAIDAHVQGAGILDVLHKKTEWSVYEYYKTAIDVEFASWVEDTRKMVHSVCKHAVRTTDSGWYCDACGVPIFRRDNLEPARIQAKQWAFSAAKDCLASGQRWLMEQGQKFDYPPIILNAQDEPLLIAMEGTTEKETSTGMIQWDSPSRHLIDMLLAGVIAVNRLSDIGRENETPDWLNEVGWTGGEGVGQQMPWEVSYAV